MVFEPAANLEIDVARHLRLGTGVSHRLAVAGGGDGRSSGGISGVVVRSSLILGSSRSTSGSLRPDLRRNDWIGIAGRGTLVGVDAEASSR
jgi:hypothetical protein